MSKELYLFSKLAPNSLPRDQAIPLLAHATFIANGFVPLDIESVGIAGPPMSIVLCRPTQKKFQYFNNVELRCLDESTQGIRLDAIFDSETYSVFISETDNYDTVVDKIKTHLIPVNTSTFATGSAQPCPPPTRPRTTSTRHPGLLVGPNHPMFTGDEPSEQQPRFDPIGPGNIGEPWNDQFVPPGFGQPPSGQRPSGRTPLRGPGANIGPGGMFM